MASPLQQRSRIRKGIYAGLIVVLFTATYLYRENIILGQANSLGLREETQGEVALTDSAIRLSLTGSKGLAVCLLWTAAGEKKARHEWNELEMLVDSVSKLQPHFISPWLFQSWNIAFNVSVECDSPQDKYFYICRGTQLLADGERRNRGRADPDAEIIFPGNPDLRFHLGLFYQLKIGRSDETKTMRCLYQMSCMNPAERNPANLMTVSEGQPRVNQAEFRNFCRKHPRLVRRLREGLHFDTPESVVEFLIQHKDVPSRYEPIRSDARPKDETLLKQNVHDRFPIMPPESNGRPFYDEDDRKGSSLGDDFDNFAAAREWFIFAQKPLPPCDPDFSVDGWQYDQRKYRAPKMTHYIFRQYPYLGQSFVAENLAEEGWFDEQGWTIVSRGEKPVWFRDADGNEEALPVAKNLSGYSSGQAWKDAYQVLLAFGRDTKMVMPEEKRGTPLRNRYEQLRRLSQSMDESDSQKTKQSNRELMRVARAHAILGALDYYRHLVNFEVHYYQSRTERQDLAVRAHKHYFEAERLWEAADRAGALDKYQQWIKEWKTVLVQNPRFREKDDIMQEDSYEHMLRYMRRYQEHHKQELKALFLGLAQSAIRLPSLRVSPLHKGVAALGLFSSPCVGALQGLSWTPPRLDLEVGLPRLLTREQQDRIIPTKQIRGPFDGDEPGTKGNPFFDPNLVERVRKKVMYPHKGLGPSGPLKKISPNAPKPPSVG